MLKFILKTLGETEKPVFQLLLQNVVIVYTAALPHLRVHASFIHGFTPIGARSNTWEATPAHLPHSAATQIARYKEYTGFFISL